MEKLNRGDKIYLDSSNTEESLVNTYLDCRDGIVEVYEYNDFSGYGHKTRLFLCRNTKSETISIIRQIWIDFDKVWVEERMHFDKDSFEFLEAIIEGKTDAEGGKYTMVRDYSEE